MRILGCLLALLLIVCTSLGNEVSVPTQFDKQPGSYLFISKVALDVDAVLKEIGIDAQACRLETVSPVKTYPGAGSCLYHAIDATIEQKAPSSILIWVKNKDSKLMPPLRIVWQHSHSKWSRFMKEFLYMSFEDLFGRFLSKKKSIEATPDMDHCQTPNVPTRDLGNFLGNLTIHIPTGHRISEYISVPFLQAINTETLQLSAKVPYHIHKRRVYQAQLNYQNPEGESVNLSVTTDFNLVAPRDACLNADFKYTPKSQGVTP